MDLPSITILALGVGAVAIASAVLWFVSGQALKLASTSQELLDLFEDAMPRQGIERGDTVSRLSTPSSGRRLHRQHVPLPPSQPDSAQQARYRWAQA